MDGHLQLPRPLSCEILFRAIPYKELVRPSDGKHKHQAFMLRPNEGGLSLFTSIEACKAHFDQPIFGIRSVQVRALREYGLDVFPDEATHATIRRASGESIPNKKQNQPEAFQIADDLMDRSRPVVYWESPDADARFQAELAGKRAERERAADQ